MKKRFSEEQIIGFLKARHRGSVRRWHLLTQQEKLDVRADIPMRKASEFHAPVHHKFGDVKATRLPT